MKIALFFPLFPLPANEGAQHVIVNQIHDLLTLGHHVTLFTWLDSPSKGQLDELGRLFSKTPKLFEYRYLEGYGGQSGQQKLFGLSKARAFGETFYYPRRPPADVGAFDWGVFHYSFSSAWLKEGVRSFKRTAVCFHNLESDLYRLRVRHCSNLIKKAMLALNMFLLARHEKQLNGLVDEIWFLSKTDLTEYATRVEGAKKRALLRHTPPSFNSVDLSKEPARSKNESNRSVLGFIGGMNFIPNEESVVWILKALLPALNARGFQGRVVVAGKCPSEKILNLSKNIPHIKFLGFLISAESFWDEIDYFLIPHVSGSGVRTKLLEALRRGIPSLTTTAGAASMAEYLAGQPTLLISDSPKEWCEFILNTNTSEKRRSQPLFIDPNKVYGFLMTAATDSMWQPRP